VIGALEDAEDYKAFEAAIIADYDAQSAFALSPAGTTRVANQALPFERWEMLLIDNGSYKLLTPQSLDMLWQRKGNATQVKRPSGTQATTSDQFCLADRRRSDSSVGSGTRPERGTGKSRYVLPFT
jgi:hypothetical protein